MKGSDVNVGIPALAPEDRVVGRVTEGDLEVLKVEL